MLGARRAEDHEVMSSPLLAPEEAWLTACWPLRAMDASVKDTWEVLYKLCPISQHYGPPVPVGVACPGRGRPPPLALQTQAWWPLQWS